MKAVFALVFLLMVSASISSSAFAVEHTNSEPKPDTMGGFSLTPTIGEYFFAGSEQRDATQSYGLKVGYENIAKSMTDSLGIEGTLNYLTTKSKTDASAVTGYLFRLDAIHPFILRGKWMPFLAVGAGGIVIDSISHRDKSPLFNYGASLKYFLEDFLAVRMDARHLFVFDKVNTRNNFEVGFGISYYFGKGKMNKPVSPPASPEAVPAPVATEVATPVKTESAKTHAEDKVPVKVTVPAVVPVPLASQIKVEAVPPAMAEAVPAPVAAKAAVPVNAESAPAPAEDKVSAKISVSIPPTQVTSEAPPESAKAKMVPSSPTAETTTGESVYYTLTEGRTTNRKKVELLFNRLKAAGQKPAMLVEKQNKNVYRLVSSCSSDRKAALKLKEQFSTLVGDAFIIRDVDAACVVVGTFLTKKEAQQELERLANKGLPTHVVKVRVSVPVWSINNGRYADQQAYEAAKTLAGVGITTTVEKVGPGIAEPEKQKVVRELTIEFESNRSHLASKYYGQLREIADFLKTSSGSFAIVEGHTDNFGSNSYNFRLSTLRAISLMNSLVKFGISRDRIRTKGFGPTRPIADNATIEGRQKNRRATMIVVVTN